MKELHDNPIAGHFAFQRTLMNVQRKFFWPNMNKDIHNYCESCIICAKARNKSVRPLLRPIDIARAPFDVISIDFMGPINPPSRQGNSYIMLATCLFSKYIECTALPDSKALKTTKALIKMFFYRHGAPKCILSDRGANFRSKLFRIVCSELKIQQKFTTAYHPQGNGATERQNRNIITLIRRYINEKHDDWEDLLEPLRFAYCNSVNSSTHETPYFLVHGRDPITLIDRIFDELNKKLVTPQDYKSQLIILILRFYNVIEITPEKKILLPFTFLIHFI